MSEMINVFEKFMQYKKLVLSDRFIWLFVFGILATIAYYLKQNTSLIIFAFVSLVLIFNSISVYPWENNYFKRIDKAINSFNYEYSQELIENKPLLISYPSKITYDFFKIQYNLTFDSDSKNLFKSIELLENKYLLKINDEETKFILSKLNIYKKFENIKLIQELIGQLDEKRLNGSNLLSFKLAKSFLLEYDGDILQAKDLLISLLDKKDIDKVLLYNAIARLEELQGNYKQAIHNYEKSFDKLKHEPKAKYFHIVLHNLVIVNTRMKNIPKSNEWLNLYESMIDKNNLSQYLEYLNTQLLVARQIRDRILLLESYSKMTIFIEPKLDEDRWMAHFSSKLRMSFNDGVNFEENIISARNLFPKIKNLKFPKNYFFTKEIFHILKTLDEKNQLGTMKEFYLKIIQYLSSFTEPIHEYKKKLPDLALSEQFYWLSEENFLMKLDISKELIKSNFENLFNDIKQMKEYALTYNNQYLQVKANMIIVDEFLAYSKVLDSKFVNDFISVAITSMKEADTIILNNTKNTRYFEFFIPAGYYHLELFDDNNKAKEYLRLFEEQKISIEQYAKWQRSYYNSILMALQ